MNVLSLFDGMSCGQIALNKLGTKVDNYFACEVDKYAIQVSSDNYPNTTHLGDVTKVDFSKLPKIDLLIGGSPCQGFSTAGKQLNFNDPRSALFFEYVRAIKETQPTYFMLENVSMKREWIDVISEHLGVAPITINSSLLSAQNRKRLYWTNIPVSMPDDKHIYLKDILESGLVDRDKSYCVDANYFKGTNLNQYLLKRRRQVVFEPSYLSDTIKERFLGDGVPLIVNGHKQFNAIEYINTDKTIKCFNYSSSGRGVNGVEGRASIADKALTLTAQGYSNRSFTGAIEHNDMDFRIRKLTVLECKRLQTVPDNYVMNVSNTQAYKMLGNGWTVDVVAHILKGITNVV